MLVLLKPVSFDASETDLYLVINIRYTYILSFPNKINLLLDNIK